MPQADRYRPVGGRFRRFFAVLGPGLISGAADDDPSAIGTYSVVGAQFGTSVLWTAFHHLAARRRHSDDVRAHRLGHRQGTGPRARRKISRTTRGSALLGIVGREYDHRQREPLQEIRDLAVAKQDGAKRNDDTEKDDVVTVCSLMC